MQEHISAAVFGGNFGGVVEEHVEEKEARSHKRKG